MGEFTKDQERKLLRLLDAAETLARMEATEARRERVWKAAEAVRLEFGLVKDWS
jgi:hypothetical protein